MKFWKIRFLSSFPKQMAEEGYIKTENNIIPIVK
jgi:hypothetical protein